MAATEPARPLWAPLMAAALALPGLAAAEGEPPAGDGLLALRWLSYQDWQPGLERIAVRSPSMQLSLPLSGRWSLDATATKDAVSGASPRWHSSISGASRMSDNRTAFDARITHEGRELTSALSVATSDEHDFESRALSAELRGRSEDRNLGWSLALGATRDRIGSVDNPDLHERRRTTSLSAGLTQVLSRADIAQATLSLSDGRGYFSDPYKTLDARPDVRRLQALLLRWNHHVEALDASLRTSWRFQRDSFGIRSHTLSAEWVAPLGRRLTVTPSLRLYSQNAASFYLDPVYSYLGAPYPPGWLEAPPRYLSNDARLAAFGALTVGLKLAVAWTPQWSSDIKFEQYEQRGSWRVGGRGSPGLAPLKARFMQVGAVHRF